MDLEKKLQFLTGNDEYSMPVKPSHTDDDNDEYYPHQSFSTNLIPIEDEDSSINLDPLSIDSYLRLDDSSSKKSKKQKKKERLEIFDSFS